MKKFFFLCLFFSHIISAREKKIDPALEEQLAPSETERETEETLSSYWRFHHAAYTGYRRDRQEFSTDSSRMKIENRNSVQLMVSSHAEFKDLVGYVRGSYAWLCNGAAHYGSFPHFNLGAGYEVDARGAFGYRIHFCDREKFGFSFIPGLGYRYASMMNFAEGTHRITTSSTQFSMATLPNPNHQDWFGPFVDARVELRFFDFCEWLLSCQYHQPYLVSTSEAKITTYSGDETSYTQIHSVFKAPASHMLLGMSDIKFNYGTGWSFGANFEGASTWSHHGLDRIVQKKEVLGSAETKSYSTEKGSLHWTFYAVSFMVIRTF